MIEIVKLEEKIEAAIRSAEGNIKHENMYLTENERGLIKAKMMGEINNDEFIKKAYEIATCDKK